MLNLGNNEFESLPHVLGCFGNIATLHIFNNMLKELNGEVIARLFNCRLLNANNNQISSIPPEVSFIHEFYFSSLLHFLVIKFLILQKK